MIAEYSGLGGTGTYKLSSSHPKNDTLKDMVQYYTGVGGKVCMLKNIRSAILSFLYYNMKLRNDDTAITDDIYAPRVHI